MTLRVFDPPCAVPLAFCGSSVDPELARFAAAALAGVVVKKLDVHLPDDKG